MRRTLSLLAPIALLAVSCNNTENGGASSKPAASASPSASSSAAASAAPEPRKPPPTLEGGSLVRAPSGDALYLADEDHGVVRKIALPFDPAAAAVTVPMPGLPAQVLALQDRVLITVRSEGGQPPAAPKADEASAAAPAGSDAKSAAKPATKAPAGAKPSRIPASPTGPGLLLIMKPDAGAGLVEVARVTLPADAWGVAVTPDEKTALISSAWTHQISAVDLATAKKVWSIDVSREPRAIAPRRDGKGAYVTHLVGGAITRIDDLGGQPKATPISLPPSPLRSPSMKTLDGTLAYSATLSPNGERLFVPRHAVGALGEASWFGAATVDVLLTKTDAPLAAKRDAGLPMAQASITAQMNAAMLEGKTQSPRVSYTPFVAPRAVVYRKKTSTVIVASEGTNAVVELDARVVDPTMFVARKIELVSAREKGIPVANEGGAPSGLALSEDESMLWVYCRTTSDLLQVNLDSKSADGKLAVQIKRMRYADDLLDPLDAKGRRIFYDASDNITSGGLSCAGCHPEGRDDGHVWHEAKINTRSGEAVNFLGDQDQAPLDITMKVGYARQTPMLAGRVAARGPYGWHGESEDLVARIKASFHLHRWGTVSSEYGDGPFLARAQFLSLFVRHGLVPPPREVRPLTEQETKGKEIFMSERARCARCHVPEPEYTDRMAYPLTPRQLPVTGFEDEKEENFKTPSLLYVAGTPPYYHDGRASTLEVLIEQNQDRMGHTSHLSAEERAALVAFLRTL